MAPTSPRSAYPRLKARDQPAQQIQGGKKSSLFGNLEDFSKN